MGRRLRCSSVTSRTIFCTGGRKANRSVKWCRMRPPRALPTAHFERNAVTIMCETYTSPQSACGLLQRVIFAG